MREVLEFINFNVQKGLRSQWCKIIVKKEKQWGNDRTRGLFLIDFKI